MLYQLVGRRRFCFENLEKHYRSSGIEFLYLKTPLGTGLLNTSDTYNTIQEKDFTDVQVLFLSRTINQIKCCLNMEPDPKIVLLQG